MKLFKLILGIFVLGVGILSTFSFASDNATNYVFFYGNGCTHCAKVEEYFDKNDVYKKFDITNKEVYFNRNNLKEFNKYAEKLNISTNQMGVPFLVINGTGGECTSLAGDEAIIKYFQDKITQLNNVACTHSGCDLVSCTHQDCTDKNCQKQGNIMSSTTGDNIKSVFAQRLGFFGIMLPAAISDSVNPCAFAVMFLLLSTILSKHKNRKKTLLAGGAFSLAIFLSYLAMGVGLFSAFAGSDNTFILKLVVGILGVLVGLANLKDYFWYGKFFVMEVPFSWRPKMADMIDKVTSPIGAFVVGILVSMFLLPCSSGPYFTILGYLSSESKNLTNRGYIYLVIYNLIFVLPMLIIAGLVGFGYTTVDKLAKIKHNNTKLIHLIVGLLMLGLGIYVLVTL